MYNGILNAPMVTMARGTGKFTGATGETSIAGYFNPQDQQDTEMDFQQVRLALNICPIKLSKWLILF